MPKKVENLVFFLRFRLLSTLIRHENGTFRKLSLNRRIWKRWLVVFLSTENILRTKLFENDDVMKITSFQNDQWLLRFMFLQLTVEGELKHLIRFHGVKSLFFQISSLSHIWTPRHEIRGSWEQYYGLIMTSPALEDWGRHICRISL